MASGEPMLLIDAVGAPFTVADQALPSGVSGGSSPVEVIPAWLFVDGAIKYLDFYGTLSPTYAGGGLTLTLPWVGAAAVNEVRWEAAFRALPDDTEAYSVAHTYDYNAVDDTAPSAADEIAYAVLTFTNGADMDNLAAGERFILRVRRNGTHANDDFAASALLLGVSGKET